MPFHVSLVGRKNLSREIYRQISRAILDGRLRPGDRLTPSRELAQSLSVSRMTVSVAYERLSAEGFVTSTQGAGTYVASSALQFARKRKSNSPGTLEPRAVWSLIQPPTLFGRAEHYDFRTGIPDASLFPHRAWYRAIARSLQSRELVRAEYGQPAGVHELRVAIARHIGFSRGVEASAEDVVVTAGTQQAIDLVARVLLAPGDAIAVEEPGYPPPRALFNVMGLRVVGVPVDRDGIDIATIPRGVRAVYVTPSHQYPLSVAMTLPRRQGLLAWAERNQAAIIEDDYDSEFRFGGRPFEPLQTIDTQGRVIYVGSFSKTMLPSLRIGFIVAPAALRDALRTAKFVSDWHTSSLVQVALARFMEEGAFARHVRRMTREYRERREIIVDTIRREFGEELELIPSDAGLHVTALARKLKAEQLVRVQARAAKRGVAFHLLSLFSVPEKARSGILLGYGTIPTFRIRDGLQRLRECFDE
ncbi:GntR family transcriptional regulator [Opitutaceae bacterium EW11]|nr:GntR family transcriptional regulator [Opitutaceae bacterium EW11]